MAKTSCFSARIVAAMSWLARSMLRTKGFGVRANGDGHAPVAPSTHSLETTALHGVRSPSSRSTERHGHEPGRIAHLHAHEDGVLALGLGFFERVAHVANVGDRLAADV